MVFKKSPSPTQNRVEAIPFQDLYYSTLDSWNNRPQGADREWMRGVYKDHSATFSRSHQLKSLPWLAPQLLAHWATQPLPTTKSSRPEFSPQEWVGQVLGSDDPWLKGCFLFIKHCNRGEWIEGQYKEPGSYYCSLVPFFLAAMKKYHNIPYSSWSRDELSWIVEPQLCEAMLSTTPDLSVDEVLQIRNSSMVIRSGPKSGTLRNPLTTYKLWGCQDPRVRELPWLTQVMITQIWCAHPQARNHYMVLDPHNWDQMPPPLLDTEVLDHNPTTTTKQTTELPFL